MSTTEVKEDYKRRIMEYLEDFPPAKLRLLIDFVEYLHDKAAWEETQAILADKQLMENLEEAEKDWNNGDYNRQNYTDWEEIKEEV